MAVLETSCPKYQRRRPELTPCYRIINQHLDSFVAERASLSGLILNLVYNPAGSFLPAPQADLERDYKRELKAKFDIDFNNLFAITNMPIHRFRFQLKKSGGYDAYMQKLLNAFNPAAANSIMCRTIISVSYDGYLYDCDFNQMLGIHIGSGSDRMSIADFNVETLLKHQIKTAEHCYGCTAGSGSSCGDNTTN